jgi:hypothetical protein
MGYIAAKAGRTGGECVDSMPVGDQQFVRVTMLNDGQKGKKNSCG